MQTNSRKEGHDWRGSIIDAAARVDIPVCVAGSVLRDFSWTDLRGHLSTESLSYAAHSRDLALRASAIPCSLAVVISADMTDGDTTPVRDLMSTRR